MNQLIGRFADLQNDAKLLNLYHTAYGPGEMTWLGHLNQAQGWQSPLRRLIKEAIKNGCPVPAGAWALATRPLPKAPPGN